MAALEDASRLLDWVSIHVFFTEYANAVDSRNWELFRSLFTKDAVLDYDSGMRVGGLNLLGAKKGSPEHISRWLEAQLATFSSSQHLIGNVQITFEGKNRATARAMFFNPMLLWGLNFLTPNFYTGGWYVHRLVKSDEDSKWRSEYLAQEMSYNSVFAFVAVTLLFMASLVHSAWAMLTH